MPLVIDFTGFPSAIANSVVVSSSTSISGISLSIVIVDITVLGFIVSPNLLARFAARIVALLIATSFSIRCFSFYNISSIAIGVSRAIVVFF